MFYLDKYGSVEDATDRIKQIKADPTGKPRLIVVGGKPMMVSANKGGVDPIVLDGYTTADSAIVDMLIQYRLLGGEYGYDCSRLVTESEIQNVGGFGDAFCGAFVGGKLSLSKNPITKDMRVLQKFTGLGDLCGFDDLTMTPMNFFGCGDVRTVVLPSHMTQLGASAFAFCVSLKDIRLPASLVRICQKAFYNCISLSKIIIPSQVEEIEGYVFTNCYLLNTVEFTSVVPPKVYDGAFDGIPKNCKIKVPKKSTIAYKQAYGKFDCEIVN